MDNAEADAIDGDESTGKQSRWWWFILQWDDIAEMGAFKMTPDECVYAGWRHHMAPTTGQLHTHVLVHFKSPMRFATLANRGYANLKYVANNDRRENCHNYMQTDLHSDGTPKGVMSPEMEEIGTWSPTGQGKRTDLTKAVETLKQHGVMRVAVEHPEAYVRYNRGLNALVRATEELEMRETMYVTWMFGTPGGGKTWSVFELEGMDRVFRLPDPDPKVWFGSYTGQPVLLIDDCIGQIRYKALLKYLDIYPLEVEVKGDFQRAKWTKVYICDTNEPKIMYPNDYDDQLERRIHCMIEFVGKYPNVVTRLIKA